MRAPPEAPTSSFSSIFFLTSSWPRQCWSHLKPAGHTWSHRLLFQVPIMQWFECWVVARSFASPSKVFSFFSLSLFNHSSSKPWDLSRPQRAFLSLRILPILCWEMRKTAGGAGISGMVGDAGQVGHYGIVVGCWVTCAESPSLRANS